MQEGSLRVWHVPQIPMKAFTWEVGSIREGVNLCELLDQYDLFQYENDVKPDYANVNGIQRYEEDGYGGYDWFDVDVEFELEGIENE